MATQQFQMTPHTDTTPVVVKVELELSGPQWCPRFPRGRSVATLSPSFQLAVSSFLWALEQAGANYSIANTFRPLEACHLMRYSWMIWKGLIKPENVPNCPGVLINWVHPLAADSQRAAFEMCKTYKITQLLTAPAATSNHTKNVAIDVSISWVGILSAIDGEGENMKIETSPRDNMNKELWALGKTFGVIRYFQPEKDRPHWSIDGR